MHKLKSLLIAFTATVVQTASALETAPGDYEPLPAGKAAILLYYQQASSEAYYQSNKLVSNDFRLRTDIGLLRVMQSVVVHENLYFEPQAILPFGHLKTSGDAQGLGQASGTGDLILGLPLKARLDTPHGDILAFGPYIYVPTGRYDRDDALNLGENRWRLVMQGAYIHHFNERWALDTVADVSWFGHNDDFTAAGLTLKQRPRYEYQAAIRYQWTPSTTLGLGGGYITGGRTEVDGVDQNDRLDTSYARATVTHFFAPDWQFQVQLGRDLSVAQGFKEEERLNLRLLKLF